jgi:hypothetical protein
MAVQAATDYGTPEKLARAGHNGRGSAAVGIFVDPVEPLAHQPEFGRVDPAQLRLDGVTVERPFDR